MKSREIVRDKLNAYIKDKGLKNHKSLIADGHLTNGTLGRIRKYAENIKLDTLDDLAAALGTTAAELISLAHQSKRASSWFETGKDLANESPEEWQRELLLDFLTAIQGKLAVGQRFIESIPDITDR